MAKKNRFLVTIKRTITASREVEFVVAGGAKAAYAQAMEEAPTLSFDGSPKYSYEVTEVVHTDLLTQTDEDRAVNAINDMTTDRGWMVSPLSGSRQANRRWEIQRRDSDTAFTTDEEALHYVWAMAILGLEPERRALRFLIENEQLDGVGAWPAAKTACMTLKELRALRPCKTNKKARTGK